MNKEIIGDDYPTYEESVKLTLAEKGGRVVELEKENLELKHRLSCIEGDIEIIGRHIENTCADQFERPSRCADNCEKYEDNSVYADCAWHNVSNIEIACDLNDNAPLEWGSKVKSSILSHTI